LIRDLTRRLESLPLIEQAKGILMARHAIDADTAFSVLVSRSQQTNRKLRDIAAELVRDATSPPSPDLAERNGHGGRGTPSPTG
jgi:AmiR/NasT family two-component response regulator